MLTIKIKKLPGAEDLPDPHYAYEADAGLDVFAREEVVLAPGERAQIPTGIAIELPHGYVALVWDKSGVSHKGGIKTLGGVGDAGYRGEYMVGVVNLSKEKYTFKRGDKVAQILIQKVEHPNIEFVDELSDAERGDRGFGSSGK